MQKIFYGTLLIRDKTTGHIRMASEAESPRKPSPRDKSEPMESPSGFVCPLIRMTELLRIRRLICWILFIPKKEALFFFYNESHFYFRRRIGRKAGFGRGNQFLRHGCRLQDIFQGD